LDLGVEFRTTMPMPLRNIFLLFFSFLLTISAEKVAYDSEISISNAERVIDVRTHVEEVVTHYQFENNGKKPVSYVLVAFSPEQTLNLAYFHAVQIVDKKPLPLKTTVVSVDINEARPGTVFYKVTLNSPLTSQGSASIQTQSSFTHALKPFPKQITQADNQLVKLNENAYIFAAYDVAAQSTRVKVGHVKLESYTKKIASLKGDDLELDFQDVKPFSFQEFSVHFENNNPFATARTLVKEIEISHWGNVAIEESYMLEHTGAELVGPFSRYDYQRIASKPSFRQITAFLPASATNIYYRDQIGNVSTSNVREGDDGITFEVSPRFPMFGGWKTDFYIGYNLPASEFLFVDSDTGNYFLNISFGTPFPQLVVDDFELRVILPEGSSDIKWTTPFDIDSESQDSRVTYLDTFGRPVLNLKKKNLVRHHDQHFQVAYSFSRLSMFREPFMLITAFGIFFGVSILYARISQK